MSASVHEREEPAPAEPIEAKRNRVALRDLRLALNTAIKVGGKNMTLSVSDLLNLLDHFEDGRMDDKLDNDAKDAVTGPHYPLGVQ